MNEMSQGVTNELYKLCFIRGDFTHQQAHIFNLAEHKTTKIVSTVTQPKIQFKTQLAVVSKLYYSASESSYEN